MAQLRERYTFWNALEGVVISAEFGLTKPDRRIFTHLLARFGLAADETVFLDDHPVNVDGARAAGLHACLFECAQGAARDLARLGLAL